MADADVSSPISNFRRAVINILDAPVVFVRERIAKPNQQHYPWYHQKFRRVPNIDECYVDDALCYHEAQAQFIRDKLVDDKILSILRRRFEVCRMENTIKPEVCEDLLKVYKEAEIAWFGKYGQLGPVPNVRKAYMKQKHRMVWERRHGPLGSGKSPQNTAK